MKPKAALPVGLRWALTSCVPIRPCITIAYASHTHTTHEPRWGRAPRGRELWPGCKGKQARSRFLPRRAGRAGGHVERGPYPTAGTGGPVWWPCVVVGKSSLVLPCVALRRPPAIDQAEPVPALPCLTWSYMLSNVRAEWLHVP
jgi:hypothetical protein